MKTIVFIILILAGASSLYLYAGSPGASKPVKYTVPTRPPYTVRRLERLKRELTELKKIHGEKSIEVASVYRELGLAYALTGNTEKEIESYLEASILNKQVYADSHIVALTTLGDLARALRKDCESRDKRMAIYKQILTGSSSRKGYFQSERKSAYSGMVQILEVTGDFEGAFKLMLACYKEILPTAKMWWEGHLLAKVGWLAYCSKNKSEADLYYRKSIAYIRTQKTSLMSEMVVWSYSDFLKGAGKFGEPIVAISQGEEKKARDGVTKHLANAISGGFDAVLNNISGEEKLPKDLSEASVAGNLMLVEKFLKEGADFSVADGEGMSPFLLSIMAGNIEIATLLAKKGADVKKTDNSGSNALHLNSKGVLMDSKRKALSKIKTKMPRRRHIYTTEELQELQFPDTGSFRFKLVDYLLSQGLEVSGQDDIGATPLHWAARSGSTKLIHHLIRKGAKADCLDKLNRTPLHYAVLGGSIHAVQALLNMSVDVNKQDIVGYSPLHLAYISLASNSNALSGAKSIIEILKSKGADAKLKSAGGHTAEELQQLSEKKAKNRQEKYSASCVYKETNDKWKLYGNGE